MSLGRAFSLQFLQRPPTHHLHIYVGHPDVQSIRTVDIAHITVGDKGDPSPPPLVLVKYLAWFTESWEMAPVSVSNFYSRSH